MGKDTVNKAIVTREIKNQIPSGFGHNITGYSCSNYSISSNYQALVDTQYDRLIPRLMECSHFMECYDGGAMLSGLEDRADSLSGQSSQFYSSARKCKSKQLVGSNLFSMFSFSKTESTKEKKSAKAGGRHDCIFKPLCNLSFSKCILTIFIFYRWMV